MNLILLHCFFAWLCAQGMKVLLCYWNHSFKLERCVGTGGMPSSQSSTVCCLAASIAMQDGLSSSTFAIAFIFAFIVVYDALNLRYQCGLHAKEINEINRELHRPVQLNESLGHRMCEVTAGCMIGIIIAWI